jgi:hypothetical protein
MCQHVPGRGAVQGRGRVSVYSRHQVHCSGRTVGTQCGHQGLLPGKPVLKQRSKPAGGGGHFGAMTRQET